VPGALLSGSHQSPYLYFSNGPLAGHESIETSFQGKKRDVGKFFLMTSSNDANGRKERERFIRFFLRHRDKQGEKMNQASFAAFTAKAQSKGKKKFGGSSEEESQRLMHLNQHPWADKHAGWRWPAV
jgi:hypothetical protein